jgi:adenylate cyclase
VLLAFGDNVLDSERRELRRGAAPIAVEPQVFDLLLYLVQQRDRVVSKDDLLQAVWGGRIVSDSALAARINAARRALGDDGKAQGWIRTLPRKGVRFLGAVREEPEAAPASSPPPRLSIVVLPFTNLSDDREQQYFADGVTEDLTTDLSRISGAFVIARSTAFTYKGKSVDVKQLGRELGVHYVLEGSVRRAADRVQVNVQLIDAESSAHVWADRFEADHGNLAETQREITGRLAWALNLELVRDVGRRIEQEDRIDPAAQDLVMLGWAWWHRPRSAGTMQEARRAFERALEIDARSVDARVGLARVLSVDLAGNFAPRPETGFQHEGTRRIESLLLEAIERDPNNPTARATMGRLRRLQNRLAESRIEFETAIALDPNDSFSRVQFALTLLFLGEPAAAIPEAQRAIRLSPRDPQLWGYYWPLGFCRLLLNEAEAAIELLTRARATNPRNWLIHFLIAAALGLNGEIDAAKTALGESLKRNPEAASLAGYRVFCPWGNTQYWSLFEKTAAVGLRRAGFPDAAPMRPNYMLATAARVQRRREKLALCKP